MSVDWLRGPASLRKTVLAGEAGAGIYEAELSFSEPGAWSVQVIVPSLKAGPGEVTYR